MKVVVTQPIPNTPYSEVKEVVPPYHCARVGWTPEENYRPDASKGEEVFLLADDAEVEKYDRWRAGSRVDPANPGIFDVKYDKRVEMATARQAEEVGGFSFGGVLMHSDYTSQGKYTAAVTALVANPSAFQPYDWKGIDGWLRIDSPETLMNLATACQVHVALCFAKEKGVDDAIDAAETVEEVNAVSW